MPAITQAIKRALYARPALANAVYRAVYALKDYPVHVPGAVTGAAAGAVFDGYFQDNTWGDPESVSGPGSSREATAMIRETLPALLSRLRVKTLLDAPCGDFAWMRDIVEGGAFDYIGGDIVGELVAGLQSGNRPPRARFVQLDICSDPLPPADLWLSRDCFIHLPNAMIRRALANFHRSGIPWLLISQYDFARENKDIGFGGFRPVNLRKEPFALPAPRDALFDFHYPYPPRKLALWHRDDILPALRG